MDSPSSWLLRRRSIRKGSLVVEAAIATALMGTALYALAQLAQHTSQLSQLADQRLSATLAAGNTLQRLRRLPLDQLTQQVDGVAQSVTADSGHQVSVRTKAFTLDQQPAIQIRVDVQINSNVNVTLHDWRISTSDAAADSGPTAGTDTTSESDGEGNLSGIENDGVADVAS